MASTVTLLQLRTRVRRLADMEGSAFVSDAELTDYVNDAADELYERLVKLHEDEYVAEATFTTGDASSTLPSAFPVTLTYLYDDEVALPSNFFKLLRAQLKVNGRWYPLTPWRLSEMERLKNDSSSADGTATRYRLQGQTLKLLPTPPVGLPGKVYYVPRRPPLVADADELDGVMGWQRWVEVDAAIRCLLKEEGDVRVLLAERERLDARIAAAASTRDVSPGALAIQDVRDTAGSEGWE